MAANHPLRPISARYRMDRSRPFRDLRLTRNRDARRCPRQFAGSPHWAIGKSPMQLKAQMNADILVRITLVMCLWCHRACERLLSSPTDNPYRGGDILPNLQLKMRVLPVRGHIHKVISNEVARFDPQRFYSVPPVFECLTKLL